MTRVLLSALLVLLVAIPVTANHGRPYSANVKHARQWSRAHTTDRGWRCLDKLWHAESGWSVHARTGRAYGIPQAYPGKRMAAAERPKRGEAWDDWHEDGLVQVLWGLELYIRPRYGGPCPAWHHVQAQGWY